MGRSGPGLRQRPRRWAAACLAAAAAAAGLALAPGWGTAGPVGASSERAAAAGKEEEDTQAAASVDEPAKVPSTFKLPAGYAETLADAWRKVDALAAQVERHGVLPGFGRKAQGIVDRAINQAEASGAAAESLAEVLDGPLRALFQRQLQTLLARAADLYEEQVAARPNPLEAGQAAEEAFLAGAADLVRPGSGWSFEAEHNDLVERMKGSFGRDEQLVQEQAKQGRGKEVTIEVIRKLQQQQAAVQREAESRGAFPWNIKWQYMVENSPVGFRGQYTQGRSIVELLLMPSPDPRYKKNILNRIGPLNLAVAFDMLL